MKMRTFLASVAACAIFVCLPSLISAQTNPPPIQWARCYGGYGTDYARSIQQTFDGGYIVVGYSDASGGDVTGIHKDSSGYESDDYWVVKLDSLGILEWEKAYGGSGTDLSFFVQQTRDSGYIIAGMSNSTDGDVTGNHGKEDYWIVKLDKKGDMQWQKALGGSKDDIADCIRQTSDGGYVVCGESESKDGDVTGNHGENDYWIVKLNDLGNIEWQRSLGGSYDDIALSIQQTRDNGYIVAGVSSSLDGDVIGNDSLGSVWIVKLDSAGNIGWQQPLKGSSSDYPYSIQQTFDGGYVVAGTTSSPEFVHSFIDNSFWVLKLDSIGNIEWQKAYGGSDPDEAYSIQQTFDSGYVIAGPSSSNDGDVKDSHDVNDQDNEDYWIVKIDGVGNLQWEKSLGGTYEDIAYSIQQSRDSGYVIAGWSNSYDGDVTGQHGTPMQGAPGDFWIVKLHEKVKSCYSDTINFDTVNVGDCKQYTYCFADNGGAPYLFSGVVFFGANANEFSLRSATFKELKPGNEEEVVLNFCPSAIGERTAIAGLIVSDTDTIFIPLYGTGVQPAGVAMQSPGSPLLSARNYPNPFSSTTQLEYMVTEAGEVRVTVVDNVGEAVSELFNGWQAAGTHTIVFDANDLPAGAYFVRYSCNGMVTTKPCMVLR